MRLKGSEHGQDLRSIFSLGDHAQVVLSAQKPFETQTEYPFAVRDQDFDFLCFRPVFRLHIRSLITQPSRSSFWVTWIPKHLSEDKKLKGKEAE